MNIVPFFPYQELFADSGGEYLQAIEGALARGAYIMQRELFEFEEAFAKYLGVKYAVGVADGTVALTLSLRLADIGPGDEVILPSHTFIATAAAVHHVGATPVICDCGPDSCIDIASARQMVTSKTRGIMPVQLNGRVSDMDGIETLACEYGLKIIEDSCQAFGAKYRNRFAGTFGVAGSFSFYPSKTLGCFGDGGALIVNDDDLLEKAHELRDHGRGKDGKVHRFGVNGRLDNIQAAVLLVKLKRYDENIRRRRAVARIYHERLGGNDEILLPPAPDSEPYRFDIFQNFEIQTNQRDLLREHLLATGVGTIIQWGGYMIHQFDELNLRSDCPYAEQMAKRYMMLPMHHMLTDDQVHYVCDQVERFYHG